VVKFFPLSVSRVEARRVQERNLRRLLFPFPREPYSGEPYGSPHAKPQTTAGHDVPEDFVARYDQPFQRMLRYVTGQSCPDGLCTLSGGMGHAGPCQSCECGDKHAIDECPLTYRAREREAARFVETARRNFKLGESE
jgi:hypothetical protein